MPPGAKKRKALKKKQQQQLQQKAIGTSANNNETVSGGNEEHGSQDDRESDSNLSSPGSQGNQEFGGTKDPSAAMVKEETTAKEVSDVIAVEIGTDAVEKNVSSQHPCDHKEIAPAVVVDSVSNVVISEKSETSAKSNLVVERKKSAEANKEYPTTGPGKENGKVAAAAATGTSGKVESARESEVPPSSSEEKRGLLPGPQAVRTSWLSCCGLFDAMTGSER